MDQRQSVAFASIGPGLVFFQPRLQDILATAVILTCFAWLIFKLSTATKS